MKWLFYKNWLDLWSRKIRGLCIISSKRKLFVFLVVSSVHHHNSQKMFFTDMREMRYATALNKENCSVNFISWLFWACFHRKTLRVDHLTTSTRLMITPFPRQQKRREKAIASGFQQTIKAKMLLYFIPWLLFKY